MPLALYLLGLLIGDNSVSFGKCILSVEGVSSDSISQLKLYNSLRSEAGFQENSFIKARMRSWNFRGEIMLSRSFV